MNIPATGPNKSKENFFREVSTAFTFLEIFYRLSKEQQENLMEMMTRYEAQNEKG